MKKGNIIWLIIFVLGTIIVLSRNRMQNVYQQDSGLVFGTVYKITYQHKENLKDRIVEELERFDGSLSPFNDTSIITKVNRNEPVKIDTYFRTCVSRALEISEETDGMFDITVAPLVNAWGFGFKKGAFPDSAQVDSMMQFVGYQKIRLEGDSIIKDDPRVLLNCSAVAKGYAVDVIARFLESEGVENYLVDIGGEIVTKGMNPDGGIWRIGINKPIEDSLSINQEIGKVLELRDAGLATSGNYRNFYYKDGVKYAHTISPKTGYPVQQSILSATVVARDCMTADAYATSFMVMNLEQVKAFVQKNHEVDVYLIYAGPEGGYEEFYSEGMKKYLK